MSLITVWRLRARALKSEMVALYFAIRHPGTPWYAKVVAGCVVAYALSPIDLIPDFIPVLGYLDDLVLVPAGIALVIKLVPAPVMAECRERARALDRRLKWSLAGAIVVAGIWLALGGLLIWWLVDLLS